LTALAGLPASLTPTWVERADIFASSALGLPVMQGFDLQHFLCHARDGIDDGIMAGKGVSAASDSAGMAKMRQAAIAAGSLLMLAFIV